MTKPVLREEIWQASNDGEEWYDTNEVAARHYRYRRRVQVLETGETTYDKTFGDDRMCECGHVYYRHFDWMEDYRPGCKYCECILFKEKKS